MSPVRPSGGESLQEMIDRYNRELMEMGRLGQSHGQPTPPQSHQMGTPPPRPTPKPVIARPRPEPNEPLHRPGSGMPRPFPTEPLDTPPDSAPGMNAREQGLKDIEQGRRDREQGMRDIEQAQRDREHGMRDVEQAQRDRERGMREIEQSRLDREQGLRDSAQGRKDLERGLQELREGLLALERKQQDYLNGIAEREYWLRADHSSPFSRAAVSAAAAPESEREQWLRDLEQGRRELEQGMRDLEQGLRDREQGVRDYEQGLAERNYWLSQSRPASAPAAEATSRSSPAPVSPTIPGRVPAQIPSPGLPSNSYGTLIVQVYTARRAEPVSGARVIITLPTENGETLYKVVFTDEDGRTEPVQLPVAGFSGGAPSFTSPSANYRVYATAENFQPSGGLNAQMFQGVTSLLPVELIPGEQVMR